MDDHFTLKVDGEDHEVFMSFGLLRDLSRYVNAPELIISVLADTAMLEDVLEILLAERSKTGTVITPFKIEDHELEEDGAMDLASWAMDHLISFFLKRFEKMAKVADSNRDRLSSLRSQFPGFGPLAGMTPSAGQPGQGQVSSETSTGSSAT